MRLAWLASWGMLATTAACRSPTEVTLVLTTDTYDAGYGATSIVVTSAGVAVDAAGTVTTNCSPDGSIGTLVVVPGPAGEAAFVVKVMTDLGGANPPGDCVPDASHCIIATREMGFIDHTPLTLPIPMSRSCEGTLCEGGMTCVQHTCVSAKINPPQCLTRNGCYLGPANRDAGIDAAIPDGAPHDATRHDATSDATIRDSARDVASPRDTGTERGAVACVATCFVATPNGIGVLADCLCNPDASGTCSTEAGCGALVPMCVTGVFAAKTENPLPSCLGCIETDYSACPVDAGTPAWLLKECLDACL